MGKNHAKFIDELINRPRWGEVLQRFGSVLKMNIFMVDPDGQLIIPPVRDRERQRYGDVFLQKSFRFDFTKKWGDIQEVFEPFEDYLECTDPFDLKVYAIPIRVEEDKPIAFVIVGPVILHKRWDLDEYLDVAKKLKNGNFDFEDAIQEVRVVSHVTIKAVLGLLAEVVKDVVHLNLEKRRLHQKRFNKQVLPKEVVETAQNMFADIHLDELLVTVLDLALNLAQAECGSIMMLDKENKRFVVRVSRGIKEEKAHKVSMKLGEGVAGIAAKENRSFVISGQEGEGRLRPFLKRPDIKQSAVIPLSVKNKVFGVLNLHTKLDGCSIKQNFKNIKNLSGLISTAILSTVKGVA